MTTAFKVFEKTIREIQDITVSVGIMEWDQKVHMPVKGSADRARQVATMSRLIHEKQTSQEMGQLLEDAEKEMESNDLDSYEAVLIKKVRKQFDKKTKVPASLVAEIARSTSEANQQWVKARSQSDFSIFEPILTKIIGLTKEYASCFAPYDHVYDVLLDDFEPGFKTIEVKRIFDELRKEQVELVRKIGEPSQVQDDFLYRKYDKQKQLEFGKHVIEKFGYDWSRGRQDEAPHPFQTTFGMNDARITTRLDENFLNMAMFGTFHEAGHAIYELGVSEKLSGTPLGQGASSAFHESQSRLWENIVGRSYDFWVFFYPKLTDLFPDQLGDVDLDTFYKGINKVSPSLIRVEADEATYNLHIMLRMELEILLFEEKLEVSDLPEIWNEKMREYLGVVPKGDDNGVLQDIHWSLGAFGYFPTYALGNVVSAQIWDMANNENPGLGDQIRKGEFESLGAWLEGTLYTHGAKYEPSDLIRRVTGEEINTKPFINYLNEKFGRIYGI